MPKFSNGRITTTAILYNRGVPNSDRFFGALVSLNYSMLRQQKTKWFSRQQRRPNILLHK
jgi:hypothetical protein